MAILPAGKSIFRKTKSDVPCKAVVEEKLRQTLDTLDLALAAWSEELSPDHP